MLRASLEQSGVEFDLRSLGNPGIDAGRPDVNALVRFTNALVSRTEDLDRARLNLAEVMGAAAVAPTASAAGNFEMMNRILDATGVRKPDMGELLGTIGLPADWH